MFPKITTLGITLVPLTEPSKWSLTWNFCLPSVTPQFLRQNQASNKKHDLRQNFIKRNISQLASRYTGVFHVKYQGISWYHKRKNIFSFFCSVNERYTYLVLSEDGRIIVWVFITFLAISRFRHDGIRSHHIAKMWVSCDISGYHATLWVSWEIMWVYWDIMWVSCDIMLVSRDSPYNTYIFCRMISGQWAVNSEYRIIV